MTSEQALCGAFNEHVLALAERRWRELSTEGPVQLIVVGQRGARQFAARSIPLAAREPAASTLGGLRDLVKRLALLLGRRYAAGEIGSLRVVYNRRRSISEQEPTEEQILPPDLDRVRREVPPPARRYHRYLGPEALLAGLVHEYVFISLYRVAAESFASEQAARLVAMDGAMRNTERLLELVGARFAARS